MRSDLGFHSGLNSPGEIRHNGQSFKIFVRFSATLANDATKHQNPKHRKPKNPNDEDFLNRTRIYALQPSREVVSTTGMANKFFNPVENGYTDERTGRTQHIIGTTRRDKFRAKIPGEFDAAGRPLDGHPEVRNQPMSQEYKPTDFASVFKTGQTGVDRLNKRVPAPAPTVEAFGPTPSGAPVKPMPAAAPQLNARPATGSSGGIVTRKTSYGSTETQDPATGRWVGSVSNPPPATNWDGRYPGSASAQPVAMKPLAAPLTGPMGNAATDAANLAANKALYAPGGAIAMPSAPAAPAADWWKGKTIAYDVNTTAPEAAAIGMKYGTNPADKASGGVVTYRKDGQGYAGDGTGAPAKRLPAEGGSLAGQPFETSSAPVIGSATPAAPAKPAEWFGPPASAAPAKPTGDPTNFFVTDPLKNAGKAAVGAVAKQVGSAMFGTPPKAPDATAGSVGSSMAGAANVGAAKPWQYGAAAVSAEDEEKKKRSAATAGL